MPQWTEAERTALRKAIATGAQSVRYADREVRYQSLEQMRALLAEMDAALDPPTPTSGRSAAAVHTRE